jgi:hypothetical protein
VYISNKINQKLMNFELLLAIFQVFFFLQQLDTHNFVWLLLHYIVYVYEQYYNI